MSEFHGPAPKIVFEDDWLLAVSKPAGLVVHGPGGPANPAAPRAANHGRIVHGHVVHGHVVHNLQDLMSIGRKRRLTLFHRLDKGTSGIVLLGKRPEIGEAMSLLFEKKRIRKAYYAVVDGRWDKSCNRIDDALERGENGLVRIAGEGRGQRALTTFRVLEGNAAKTWLEVMPKTGRTHQIRVHCASRGHAVLGDRLYGVPDYFSAGLALHAHRLDFTHPVTKEALHLSDPPSALWLATWLAGLGAQQKGACS